MAIGRAALVAIALTAATPASASEKALKTLHATVAAQSARIQSLEAQLRTGVCATPPKPSGGKQSKAPERCVPLDVDPEPELAAFRAGERRRAAAKKQELLTTVFNVSVGKPLTALAISSALVDHKGVPRLVAVADASGALHLYDRAGELAASVPATGETSAAIISSIIFGTKDDPFVATGSVGGEVALYNLSLPRLRSSPTSASGGPLPPPPPTTLTLAMRASPLLDERGAPVPVLTLTSYLRSRRTLLAVGDGSGALRLLHRNGTQRASVPVGGAVRVVERSKDSVHFAVAADGVAGIQLVDLSKSVPVPLVCALWGTTDEGAEVRASEGAEVVSLAWDVQLPQLLYAGTASGEMLVFNTKSRSRQPNKYGNGTESHVAVGAGAAGELQLLFSKLAYKEERPESPADAFGFGGFGEGGSGNSGHSSLLRNPMVLGVIMMLVFWQSSKFYNKEKGGGPPGVGLPPDLMRELESMRMSGGFGKEFADFGGGGSGGGRAVRESSSRIEEIGSR
eukprot:jgi/Chrpa1/3247/Chrysochromulina_OHIO_Genome00009094-RA